MVNLFMMASDKILPFKICSYNCHGFNATKRDYIAALLDKLDILLLQEHWLSDLQLGTLTTIDSNFLYYGVSGFDNSEILLGRPYGGCAILWRSSLFVNICPVSVDSKRVCAVHVSNDSWKLLLVNVYMPYEGDESKTDEFVHTLSLIEELVDHHPDSHVIIGGDFNVDFNRDWMHTALVNSFCDEVGFSPVVRHAKCTIDYSYNFNMERFNILDHFLLSGTLFNVSMQSAFVVHDVDNTSDHEPIFLHLELDATYIGQSQRVFTPRASWVKAGDDDLANYRIKLSSNLADMSVPFDVILCHNLNCQNSNHAAEIDKYAEDITRACLAAADLSIPLTTDRNSSSCKNIPGWTERVEPLREKSLFWHNLWVDCGRPRNSVVADCMRRTRAAYHYAIRQTKRDRDSIVRERLAEALINESGRDFWAEVKKIRSNKAGCSRMVDGCNDESSIARVFAAKYKSLYTSVAYDGVDLSSMLADIETGMSRDGMTSDCVINAIDVQGAISKLKLHKNDGNSQLTSDHFVHAGKDLAVHISFLVSAIICHGAVPKDFTVSTITPIPKKKNGNLSDSENFRGIALCSIFGKIFDNIILSKYSAKLSTSDLQFGFKQNNSTHMCTMILKETMSYYCTNKTPVFCTFLDASKAFDRVNYVKLFRLLLKRGLPLCIVRTLICMYTGQLIRVSWAGVMSQFFSATNGVKQGGVVSPILFCVYVDDLLIELAASGVGCYIGLNFCGAIVYADDIVLISPTPAAMRKLLRICDEFAVMYDIVFNANKSKFLVVVPAKWRNLSSNFNQCLFSIGGKPIEKVDTYPHLGHIISAKADDTDDIMCRRSHFVGQVNNLLCFFSKLDLFVKIKLFNSYCTSMYGSELWSLDCDTVDRFCCSWRTALRRLLGLPCNSHCDFLPLLTNTLPIFHEICKRSSRFVLSCLYSQSRLVQSLAWHGVVHAKYNSFIGRNALFCCKYFGWSIDDFVSNTVELTNLSFQQHFSASLTQQTVDSVLTISELILLREEYSVFVPDASFLSRKDIELMIAYVSTN